jgi:hypothetical protein
MVPGMGLLLWDYDLHTLAPLSPYLVGEFLIGCGMACAVHKEPPWILAEGRYLLVCLSSIFYLRPVANRAQHGVPVHARGVPARGVHPVARGADLLPA